jgi:hypothetical protein
MYWTSTLLAAAHGQLGHGAEARAATSEVLKLYPDYPAQARKEMEKFNFRPEVSIGRWDPPYD